jgi:hypothetical protein
VAECALIETCIFFNDRMQNMPSMTNMYKERYCRGEWQVCARYRVYEVAGRENVPKDLYPNEAERVDAVLSDLEE